MKGDCRERTTAYRGSRSAPRRSNWRNGSATSGGPPPEPITAATRADGWRASPDSPGAHETTNGTPSSPLLRSLSRATTTPPATVARISLSARARPGRRNSDTYCVSASSPKIAPKSWPAFRSESAALRLRTRSKTARPRKGAQRLSAPPNDSGSDLRRSREDPGLYSCTGTCHRQYA